MRIAEIWEWDMPKNTERLKLFYDFHSKSRELILKVDEKYNRTRTGWSQGTDHIIFFTEFADADDYAEYMKDEEAQRFNVDFCRYVNNVIIRTCRPAIYSHPE